MSTASNPAPVIPAPIPITISDSVLQTINSGMALATALLNFAGKVWDATPEPIRAQSAGDWAKFTHGLASPILRLQQIIDSAIGGKP